MRFAFAKTHSQLRRRLGVVLVMGALVSCGSYATEPAASAPEPAPYNFGWKVSGAAPAAPAQIFDNGNRVYLQFGDPKHVPVILADVPGGQILLEWHSELPYTVINHMESQLEFHLGSAVAFARREQSVGGAPLGVETGAAAPVRVTASALPPVSFDVLVKDRHDADLHTVDDSVLHDGTSVPGNTAAPLTTEADSVPRQSANQIPGNAHHAGPSFELRLEDRTIDRALQRWGEQSGWTVRWVSVIEPPITQSSMVPGDFLTACATVALALQKAGYPLTVTIDNDRKTYLIQDVSNVSDANRK